MSNLSKVSDKINSYKSYSTKVKNEVLKQLENRDEISDDRLSLILKRIPTVMQKTRAYLTRYDRTLKAVYRLERHKNSPEMNQLQFKDGEQIKVPSMTTISDAVAYVVKNRLAIY